MALPTVYFYNKNRYQVTVLGEDLKHYYLPPRTPTYLSVALHADQQVPPGVSRIDTPPGWNETMGPWTKPWTVQ
jgi:hypothetical protein